MHLLIPLSLSNSISFGVCAIWSFVGSVQYATISPKLHPPPPQKKKKKKKMEYAFVFSRLDYRKLFLLGYLNYLPSKLQKVQNNAAKLIFTTSGSAQVTPILHSLHWLPIEQRIEYFIFVCSRIESVTVLSLCMSVETEGHNTVSKIASNSNRITRVTTKLPQPTIYCTSVTQLRCIIISHRSESYISIGSAVSSIFQWTGFSG